MLNDIYIDILPCCSALDLRERVKKYRLLSINNYSERKVVM